MPLLLRCIKSMTPHDPPPSAPVPAGRSSSKRGFFGLRVAVLAAVAVVGIVLTVFVVLPSLSPPGSEDHEVVTEGPYVNVRDYGAVGDGITDDTAAIQDAISNNVGRPAMQTIYFPAGTYVVSSRLEWRDERGNFQPYLTLQGESRDLTTIRLEDGATGFDDPGNPRAVIFTASGLFSEEATGGGKNYQKDGEGNEAFRNFIYDLTVDTGSGNPGAIGIDFLGSNMAAIRRVEVRSGDGSGVAGISMTRKWVGPALLKRVKVTGFDYGIKASQSEYGITLDGIEVANQNKAGIFNSGNVLSINDLSSDNNVPAIQSTDLTGLVVIIDSVLKGGESSSSAIVNEKGEVYLRNIRATGYRSVLQDGSTVVPGLTLAEYASLGTVPSGGGSLGIEPRPTPEPPIDPVSAWVSVADFGAIAFDADGQVDYGDDSEAVQKAIDSGATTIYFPPGRYLFRDTVTVRGNVKRIEFRGSILGVTDSNHFADGRPLITVASGASSVVVLNQIGEVDATNMPADKSPYILQTTGSALVILDSALFGFQGAKGAGPLFLENVCCGRLEFDQQNVWARQLNVEIRGGPMITNNGGSLWVLGLKTERDSTVIESTAGAKTEVLGGLLYPATKVAAEQPAFINEDSHQSLIYATTAYNAGTSYTVQSLTTVRGSTKRLLTADLPRRGVLGSFVFLLRD